MPQAIFVRNFELLETFIQLFTQKLGSYKII